MAIYASKVSRGLWSVPRSETEPKTQAQSFKAVASQGLWVAERPYLPVPPVPPAPPQKVVVVTSIDATFAPAPSFSGTVDNTAAISGTIRSCAD